MPFKAYRLQRTNIFYPSMGDTPSLSQLLRTLELTQDSIDDIMDIEEAIYAKNSRGASPDGLEQLIVAARKAALLSPSLHRRIYFHLLRQSALPKKVGKNDLEALLSAYQDLMAERHRGYPAAHFPKLDGVQLFGHHGDINLDQDPAPTYDDFKLRAAILAQCGKYIHIPGMLAKIEKFRPFADDEKVAQRALSLLRALDYWPHDFASASTPGRFSIDKKFWGFVTIVLLNKAGRDELLADLVAARNTLPHFGEHVELLGRFVEAIADSELSKKFDEFKAATM
jgi:hypothetical protein